MKNYRTIGLLLLLFQIGTLCSTAKAQNILSLFKNADYTQLEQHMSSEVDVEIRRNRQNVTGKEALRMIQTRLNKFNPTDWELVHKGISDKKSDHYIILKATNALDEGLRLFVHWQNEGNRKKISSVRIRKAL